MPTEASTTATRPKIVNMTPTMRFWTTKPWICSFGVPTK